MNDSRKNIWPKEYKFAVGLSHDVDETKKTYQYITHFVRTFRPYHILSIISAKEPYWNFEKIMNLEEKYRVRSTFFFLHETKRSNLTNPTEITATFFKASFLEKKVADIIKVLHKNGWEIGLHGSYDSYDKMEQLKKEKEMLERIVTGKILGIRQHYLRLKIPETWLIQKSLGFTYDASFGSNERIGFPDNRLFPFKPFNDSFIVIPLTIMDYVLFASRKNFGDQLATCEELIKMAQADSALIVILWHQRVFNENEFPNAIRLYEDIIKMSIDRGGWVTPLIKIAEWWNAKSI